MVQGYDRFLSYVVQNDLEGVCEIKPVVNGSEISRALGAKTGPWMSKALDMVIKWQLLHPEITEKEEALQALLDRKAELGLPPPK